MSTIFTPEIVEASVEVEVKTEKRKRVVNVPPAGARIRLTLGETVIYATIRGDNDDQHSVDTLNITIDSPSKGHGYVFLSTYIWYGAGWVIEVLDETKSAPVATIALDGYDAVNLAATEAEAFAFEDSYQASVDA